MYSSNEAISKRINKIMFDLGINQKQLAKILNITQPAVSKYLQGRVPPPKILLQLSILSGMSIEWILTGKTGAPSRSDMVSDQSEQYYTKKTIEEKFSMLPSTIQNNIETLIDSILNI